MTIFAKAILNRDKNKLANYSFDKEETKIIYPENKNTIENNTSIIDNMNTLFIKGESAKKKIEAAGGTCKICEKAEVSKS